MGPGEPTRAGHAAWILKPWDGKNLPRPAIIIHDRGERLVVVYGTKTLGRDLTGKTIRPGQRRAYAWTVPGHERGLTDPTAFYSNECDDIPVGFLVAVGRPFDPLYVAEISLAALLSTNVRMP